MKNLKNPKDPIDKKEKIYNLINKEKKNTIEEINHSFLENSIEFKLIVEEFNYFNPNFILTLESSLDNIENSINFVFEENLKS